MREELKKGISNYLEKFNKYSREEYIDLECKRVDKYKPKKIAKLFKQKLTEQELCKPRSVPVLDNTGEASYFF